MLTRLFTMSEEFTPLISGDYPVTYGGETNALEGSNLIEGAVVTPIGEDELPPPYSPTTGSQGIPMVTCRVCQSMIDISGKVDQHVVKCGKCGEATPIKNAPPGKKYVRCPCNCLLICRSASQRIACPRPNCKRINNLSPSSSNPIFPSVPGMNRVCCIHCTQTFIFNTLNNALARCPHCRRVSSVGSNYARCRGIIFLMVGLFLTLGLITLIITTEPYIYKYPGIYIAHVALVIVIAAILYRAYYFFSMKISAVDGPL